MNRLVVWVWMGVVGQATDGFHVNTPRFFFILSKNARKVPFLGISVKFRKACAIKSYPYVIVWNIVYLKLITPLMRMI